MSISGRLKVAILRNEDPYDHLLWLKACEENMSFIDYRVINLVSNNWQEEIGKQPLDILLARPGRITAPLKQLYDERVYILYNILGYKIFPSPAEIFIYENKRFLSYWLKANNIPHPLTYIFYDFKEAVNFITNIKFPIVAKTNIGASGSGVHILKNIKDAQRYLKSTFTGRGSPQRIGPNLLKRGFLERGFHYLIYPSDISKKLSIYQRRAFNLQKGFVIFQEFVRHDFEWRVVRIGDSFFAHKKLKKGEKASGTLLKKYDNPPFTLLEFVKTITDNHRFYSQAVDIFESERGYLVNEMQCIFGQSDQYQMLVNGKPGRYIYVDHGWEFEYGDFNKNESYNLRIEFLLDQFRKNII